MTEPKIDVWENVDLIWVWDPEIISENPSQSE